MGEKQVMLPANEVDLNAVNYVPEKIEAPHLTGFWFKLFVKVMEAPLIGSSIASHLKQKNGITQMLKNTVIPEVPMFIPQFPLQEPEPGVVCLEEDGKPEERVDLALKCLPHYDPSSGWSSDSGEPFQFRYWKIRDYGYAYRSKLTTPSMVAEHFISAMEVINNKQPSAPLLISFDPKEVRRQAAASTQRFEEGNPLSILDGIFIAIKDDIDCYPHPSKGGSTWFHEVRQVKADAVSVSRLRNSGAILVGKTNMHEFGMGTTGNNPNYGTPGNPHNPKRYTGGSSSGSAAIVASGLCSAALGTDGGGSVRIPASLCGVVGLKTTFGRTDLTGSLWEAGTVTIIGPIAATVEDAILVLVIGFYCQFLYKQIVNSGHENLCYSSLCVQSNHALFIYLFDLITYAIKIILLLHSLHSASISLPLCLLNNGVEDTKCQNYWTSITGRQRIICLFNRKEVP